MTKFFFDDHKKFIDLDNRKFRPSHPITSEIQSNRMECFLPKDQILGKTILDLGCCVGAAGAWALHNGAKTYTGIEIQKEYADIAEKLLSEDFKKTQFKIVQDNFQNFLSNSNERFDIVIMTGVIYCVTDPISLLTMVANQCNEFVILDSFSTKFDYGNRRVLEIVEDQRLNFAKSHLQHLTGIGIRPTPEAIKFIMESLGFGEVNQLFPKKVESLQQDVYNDLSVFETRSPTPARFAFRFGKSSIKRSPTLNEVLKDDLQNTSVAHFSNPKVIQDSWKFNDDVAKRFQQEAENHIPDYKKVQHLCLEFAEKYLKKDSRILDVGSALGETVNLFISHGFTNCFGVEVSESMIKKTKQPNMIIHSDKMPEGMKWDLVLANWTLHFIKDRKKYLNDIFNQLHEGGTLILTDKMEGDETDNSKYIEFKKSNGLSQDEIEKKANSLKDVLIQYPLNWYIKELSDIGFNSIEIINSKFMFYSIKCQK